MTSPHITHLLTDYLDETLSKASLEKMKAHLIFCNACRQHLNTLQANKAKLKSLPLENPPLELEKRILDRLSQGLESPPTPNLAASTGMKWFFPWKSLALVTTCAILFILIRNTPNRIAPSSSVSELDGKKDLEDKKGGVPLSLRETSPQTNDDSKNLASLRVPEQEKLKSQVSPFPSDDRLLQDKPAAVSSQKGNAILPFQPKLSEMERIERSEEQISEETGFELSGDTSGMTEPLEQIISNARTWKKFWEKHVQNQSPKPPLPPINFKNQDIVAIFGGNQPSGGYSIQILKIEETSWEGAPARLIYYRLISPPPGAISITVVSQPFSIKSTSRFTGPTFFRKSP